MSYSKTISQAFELFFNVCFQVYLLLWCVGCGFLFFFPLLLLLPEVLSKSPHSFPLRPCIPIRTSGCSLWVSGFPSPSRDLELLSFWLFTGNSCGWVWTRPFSAPVIIQVSQGKHTWSLQKDWWLFSRAAYSYKKAAWCSWLIGYIIFTLRRSE